MSDLKTCAYCFSQQVANGHCLACGREQFDHVLHAALEPGTVLRGSYVVGVMLGEGSFGKTYKAHHTQLDKLYVLKELYPEGLVSRHPDTGDVLPISRAVADHLDKSRDSFLKEARTLSDIDGEKNPEIVKVYDFFEAKGTAYIVMPFLEGETLGDIIGQEGALIEQRVLVVLRVLLRALRVAHRAGILHQDVKPENVYMVGNRQPVLIDFGNAREQSVFAGRQHGTPGYAPPEQGAGRMGVSGDIYALGATIYACLTAQAPPDAVDRVAGEALNPTVASMRGKVSDLLLDFVEKAMQLRPEDRYASVDEVFTHLRPLLEPKPDWVRLLPKSRLSAQLARVQSHLEAGRAYALTWNWGPFLGGALWFLAHRLVPVGGAVAVLELLLVVLAAFGGELWFLWLVPLLGFRVTQGLLGTWVLYRDLSQQVTQLRTSGVGQSEALSKALATRLLPNGALALAGLTAGPVAFLGAFALAAFDMEAARAKVAQDVRVERLMCKMEDHIKATGLPPTRADLALAADQAGGHIQSYELEDAHIVVRLKEPEAVAGRALRLSFDPKQKQYNRCDNVDLPPDWVPVSCMAGGRFTPPRCQ